MDAGRASDAGSSGRGARPPDAYVERAAIWPVLRYRFDGARPVGPSGLLKADPSAASRPEIDKEDEGVLVLQKNWTELIKGAIEYNYSIAGNLIDLVDEGMLDWKPATGSNWMTTGQLLKHISDACGAPMRGFVTGDWGMPEGMDINDLSPEDMLPPAEKTTSGSK